MSISLLKYSIVISLTLLASIAPTRAQAQKVLTEEDFIEQVKQFHPVVKQGVLIVQKASADLLTARGAFDPRITAGSASKTLDGLIYYRYTNPELKIPTATGINLKAGYEKSDGVYINPERTNGVASYLGVEIPLLNGLLTDKKRTTLRQAAVYKELTDQERGLMINDLLFNARTSYWEWAGSWYMYHVFTKFIEVADERSRLVALSYKNGERALADTIETWAQLQSVKLMQSAALLELNKKAIELSSFLWSSDGNPYLLTEDLLPDTANLSSLRLLPDSSQLLEQLRMAHPAIQMGRFKTGILEAERKLKLQNFLPVVNLQANLLSKEYFQFKNGSGPYLENNYKLGLQVQVPLLWRQQRGEYKHVLIKLRENNLELQQKQWALQNKLRQYFIEAMQLQDQVLAARETKRSYEILLRMEGLKFNQGESSIFLINARENKLLEMQQKLIGLQVKYRKAVYGIQWSAGLM